MWEFLLVAVIVAAGVAAVMYMNRRDNISLNSTPIAARIVMAGVEVPLGDAFVCTVRLDRFGRPEFTSPHYTSRIRLAWRGSKGAAPLVLDVSAAENFEWHLANCRTWYVLPDDSLDEYLRRRYELATAAPEMSVYERWCAEVDYKRPAIEAPCELDEAILHALPQELQQSGLLVSAQDTVLTQIATLSAFPLSQLAAAIEAASTRDGWTTADPQSLLPRELPADRLLTADEQQQIAQALVRRLLKYLPREHE